MYRIKEARALCGWTQEQLANSVGTTQQTIQRWESGNTEPKISDLNRISNAMGITLSFLLGIESQAESDAITKDERELIALFRKLSPKAKNALIVGLKTYTE